MNTTVYFIVLGIFLVSVLLSIFIKKNEVFKYICIGISLCIFTFGIIIIPSLSSSKENQIIRELSKSEYTVIKVPEGLLVDYKNNFLLFDNYKIVNSFNDSTKIYLIEEKSFYRIIYKYSIRINNQKINLYK